MYFAFCGPTKPVGLGSYNRTFVALTELYNFGFRSIFSSIVGFGLKVSH